jgi:hypothetical protein
MAMEETGQIRDSDVFAVADKGEAELKSGATELSKAALELLVLLDAKSSIADIIGRTKALSPAEVRQTARMLLLGEYIKPATLEQELNIDFSYFFADQPAPQPSVDALGACAAQQSQGPAFGGDRTPGSRPGCGATAYPPCRALRA